MYRLQDSNGSQISLHDCRANNMYFENGILSFVFPDGFWVLPDHAQNESENVVRTDCARVDFHLVDETTIYVFEQSITGSVIRKEWKLDRFIQAVNDGTFQLEFIDEYKAYQSRLFKCWVWFKKKPYHYECELLLPCEEVTCFWNNLRYDRVW